MPFWSRLSRVELAISTAPALAGFRPRELTVDEWISRWLPGLTSDGLLVGLNWSGSTATGYDVAPNKVLVRLAMR